MMDKYNNLVSKLDSINKKLDLVLDKLEENEEFEGSLFGELKKAGEGSKGKKAQSLKPVIEPDFDLDDFKEAVSRIGKDDSVEINSLVKSIARTLGR